MSIKKSKYGFGAFSGSLSWWSLFQLIVRLNPDFNCCISFSLSWVDKVTTGTKNFVSVIVNAVAWVEAVLDITRFAGQVWIRLILTIN